MRTPPAAQGLRKPSEREGTLRIVSIDGLDRSACGGTHVRATGEIGPVLLRKLEKIRQSVRVEFVCGGRAVRRARADFEALSRVAQLFSAPLDEVAPMVAAQLETARAGDRARRKLELDLAAYQGKELYTDHRPGPDGVRRAVRRLASRQPGRPARAGAELHGAGEGVFVATLDDPPSVLLAASADSGVDAGKAAEGGAHRGRRTRRRQRADGAGLRPGRGFAGRPGGKGQSRMRDNQSMKIWLIAACVCSAAVVSAQGIGQSQAAPPLVNLSVVGKGLARGAGDGPDAR